MALDKHIEREDQHKKSYNNRDLWVTLLIQSPVLWEEVLCAAKVVDG
jgi:hypothetical protein